MGAWSNGGHEQPGRGAITEEGPDELKRHGANFIGFFHSSPETTGAGPGSTASA